MCQYFAWSAAYERMEIEFHSLYEFMASIYSAPETNDLLRYSVNICVVYKIIDWKLMFIVNWIGRRKMFDKTIECIKMPMMMIYV